METIRRRPGRPRGGGRRTLTGRRERNTNNTIVVDRRIQQAPFRVGFKCALQQPPEDFTFNLGLLDNRCISCSAYNFKAEQTSGDRRTFSLCCHKGKVILPPLRVSPIIQRLLENRASTDLFQKRMSVNYIENIRSFNASFAMVSSECHLDDSVANGVYNFKIHDTIYHRIGGLIPHDIHHPKYAELYFYDVDIANRERLNDAANQNCDPQVMNEIALHLAAVNPFVQSFKMMREVVQEAAPEETANVRMFIMTTPNQDSRRYNDARCTDVAAIFKADNGAPPGERSLVVYPKAEQLRFVSVLEPSLDPMAYPLLFPYGELGWHPHIQHSSANATAQRHKTTLLQFISYRLAIRDGFSILHRSAKLFQQFVVDAYVRIEGTRLQFIRHNQSQLRVDLYLNVTDYVRQRASDENMPIGRQVILPSSFIGSPRNMNQNYLDSMAMVQKFGKPSLFITMTCNPCWSEISDNLKIGESANMRPDLVVRVFHCKLKELMSDLTKTQIFGKVVALVYTIEFQKRGLPHAHILLTLDPEDRIRDFAEVDKYISAELPDQLSRPVLYDLVKTHMIHGPCGELNPSSVCMVNGVCSKHFPKEFIETTRNSRNGYPLYRRRDNNSTAEIRGKTIDNRYVVPYNSFLLMKYRCHLNVEACTTVKSIKYIFKYVHKGFDCATVKFTRGEEVSNQLVYDEISSYLSGRYVGSTEAVWRIFEYEMQYQTHTIVRLDCHLPNQQVVYFREGGEDQAVANPRQTKLQAYFRLNQVDHEARIHLYNEIPQHYTWNESNKSWKKRQRGSDKVISRLYTVNPKNVELFHLRLLLLHVRGAKCFEDMRTYNGVIYNTFVEAAHARGIASNDNEWRETLLEACQNQTPYALRQLFGIICALNVPTNALALWEEFRTPMSEDYARQMREDIAINRALIDIEEILLTNNTSCNQLGLPTPSTNSRLEHEFDVMEQNSVFEEMYVKANQEQKTIIDTILLSVQGSSNQKVFCLSAHAGCGKTFVQKAILCKLRSLNISCLPCAFSGIAASLLDGGRTLHHRFGLPIPILENSVSSITANSAKGDAIRNSTLILIDEISMCPVYALQTIDRLLRDFCDSSQMFGGKTVLLCGDFRQTLPVITRASRAVTVENCVKYFPGWNQIKQLKLSTNMRAHHSETEFMSFLKNLGDGTLPVELDLGEDIIELPNQIIGVGDPIEDIYGSISEIIETDEIVDRAILCPKNEDCSSLNSTILEKVPGQYTTYYSFDKVLTEDGSDDINYPTEFLNSLSISGLPANELKLKENAVVMLIRNLDTAKGIINGTRMRVKRLHRNSIDCEVLTGAQTNRRILIPRIHMRSSDTLLPFSLQRTQFPIIVAFAMTINKAQGQSLGKVGVVLQEPVFGHGQLYVAVSRARSFDGLKVYIKDGEHQGRLRRDNHVYTRNIVYREIL